MNNRRIFTVEVDQNNPKVKKYHTMYVLEDTGGITDALVQKLNALPNIVFIEDESQIPSTGTTNTLYMIMEK